MSRLLDIRNLRVSIPLESGILNAVRGIDIGVGKGETLCIVGESGCGKSLTSLALMGLLPHRANIKASAMTFDGENLLTLSKQRINEIRGADMAMIFQDPMTSLNPAFTIGNQLVESYLRHKRGSLEAAVKRAEFLLEKVGISNASSRLGQYPHQLSGGLRQRVMIAMALMCGPKLIVADEPTTALDVTVQAQILQLMKDLQREFGMGLIVVTHDLGVVARIADAVAVMYAGEIVETGTAVEVLSRPHHPYTRGLLSCIPKRGVFGSGSRLGSIPGVVPSLIGESIGCSFSNRCAFAKSKCDSEDAPRRMIGAGNFYRCWFTPGERQVAECGAPYHP